MEVVLQVLYHYEFMIEIYPLMLENQVKKSCPVWLPLHDMVRGRGVIEVF